MRSSDGRVRLQSSLNRPLVASVVVLLAYIGLSFLNSTGGSLGTDTGAKVATLDHMVENDTNRPAVGYWAEEWDPDGDYHPLYDTRRNDDGEWINVTTLPMLVVARPLYDVGGLRLALLLPMLGALATAFACRDIARQLSGDRAGWLAFWMVAVASPVTVYALDFWEHSLGAGLMLAAIALLLRVERGMNPLLPALAAGVAFGVSATMRAETFVVAFVAVGTTCLVRLWRREVVAALSIGTAAVVGFAGPWLLNAWLESSLGGNSRTTRVTGEAQRKFWTEAGERVDEALMTWFGMPLGGFPGNVVLGATAIGALLLSVALFRRGEERAAQLSVGVVGVIYVLAFASGLGFFSGALVATPLAAAAVLVRRDRHRTFLLVIAVAATVLTWLFQLTGGAGPQWGGRYLLAPTLLLATIGVVAVLDDRVPAPWRTIFGGLAVAVTLFGLVWLNQRTHRVDAYFEDLADRPEDVVVFANGFLVREAADAYTDRRYLALGRGAELDGAVDVVRDAGLETLAVVTGRHRPPDLDAEHVRTEETHLLGETLNYHSYSLSSAAPDSDG